MEAAVEIARQLRLRDIGGLIVIDFIDMREAAHIHEVERTVRDAMRQDKARHEAGRISRFGLMEISRQRLRPAAMATTYATCPTCEGHGAVRTTESAALVALRKIHNRVALGDVASLRVTMPTDVALYLLNQKREDLAQLEQRYRTKIGVKLSDKLMPHQMELEASVRVVEQRPAVAPGTVAVAEPAPPPKAARAAAPAHVNGNGADKKKRRRRRRGKGGLKAAIALGEALSGFRAGLHEEAGGNGLHEAASAPEPASDESLYEGPAQDEAEQGAASFADDIAAGAQVAVAASGVNTQQSARVAVDAPAREPIEEAAPAAAAVEPVTAAPGRSSRGGRRGRASTAGGTRKRKSEAAETQGADAPAESAQKAPARARKPARARAARPRATAKTDGGAAKAPRRAKKAK